MTVLLYNDGQREWPAGGEFERACKSKRERERKRGREEVRVWCTLSLKLELDEREEGRVSCILMCFKSFIKLIKLIGSL